MVHVSAPTYEQLLDEAWELGRADGRFAAAFEPAGQAPARTDRCLGRVPEAFARLLWDDASGSPPSGLELNAPLWYASGFAEGLAVGRADVGRRLTFRRVFS
ncbi:UNVERIFIED_ORG: hypothetical protein E4P37_00440 [Bacillus sp. AZ43]